MWRTALLVLTLLALTGCTTRLQVGETIIDAPSHGRAAQTLDAARLGALRALRLESVTIDPVEGEDTGALAAAVRQILVEQCGAVLPIVDRVGDDVGTVRVRVEYVSAAEDAGPYVFGDRLDLGGARLTVVVVEPTENRPLAFSALAFPPEPPPPALERWGQVEGAIVEWAGALARLLPTAPAR